MSSSDSRKTVDLFDQRHEAVEIHSDLRLTDTGDLVMSGYQVDRENPGDSEEWIVSVPAQSVAQVPDALRRTKRHPFY